MKLHGLGLAGVAGVGVEVEVNVMEERVGMSWMGSRISTAARMGMGMDTSSRWRVYLLLLLSLKRGR